jgi:hypothetical protein
MQYYHPLFAYLMLALFTTILASPTHRRRAASNAEYYLQTCVINGINDYGTNKEGLYVVSYHTGAGLGDAALTSNISVASKGFLNGTYQQFDQNTTFPVAMVLGYEPYAGKCSPDPFCKIAAPKIAHTDDVLAGWAPVQIDAAESPTAGFKINGTKLVGSSDLDFGGWLGKHVVRLIALELTAILACDWWHGVPQLFYLIAGYASYQVIPASCSNVKLQVIPI